MTEPLTSGLTVPEHLSHSQVSTLSDCGGRYFLERVHRIKGRPGWASLAGSAAHSATEDLDRRLMEGGEYIDDPKLIRELFVSFLDLEVSKATAGGEWAPEDFRASGRSSREWPNKENRDFWVAKGPDMVHSWVRWRDACGWDLHGVEVAVDGEIGEVQAMGYVDRTFVRTGADGLSDFMCLDLKFGSWAPKTPEQLFVYRELLSQTLGITPRWGLYWMGRTGTSGAMFDLQSEPTVLAVHFNFKMANRQRLAGDYRYKAGNLCGSCSVAPFCPLMGGERAHEVTQPWEMTEPPKLRPPALTKGETK